jgi:tagaturonate reductase
MINIDKKFVENNSNSLKDISIGSLSKYPEKIIQFGEGNFLRAFADWQFNDLIKAGLFEGSIVVVQPIENGMIDIINKQDCLYTLLQRGIQNGQKVEKKDIISCISRGINPYSQWNDYLALASNPDMRFVISNTTEAGISYVETLKLFDQCPKSFPAKVTILLYERYKYFKGNPEKGFVFLTCELIEKNGDKLKSCIIRHALDWDLDTDFIRWVEESNYFCNTLVDRIVPGYPKEEFEKITAELGYVDKLLVTSESYHLWVIQGDKNIQDELPFVEAGLNVIWTNDITPYTTLKVRILNGMHTMFTIPAFLSGKNTVSESFQDELIRKFILHGLNDEILPSLNMPEKEKNSFSEIVLERFQNPFIKHYLLSLTLNSVFKFRVRVIPSLINYWEIKKEVPKILAFSLSTLFLFYKGLFNADNQYYGKRANENYVIKDDTDVIRFFFNAYNKFYSDPEKLCRKLLSNDNFWGMDLNIFPGLTKEIVYYYQKISKYGVKESILELIGD